MGKHYFVFTRSFTDYLDPDPHGSALSKLDPDPHSFKILYPDPHKVDADPKH
jgi:hypothetical protein